ncbi:MAG: hypothetical protein ACPG19_15015 [Saprospiraceae bacterium]
MKISIIIALLLLTLNSQAQENNYLEVLPLYSGLRYRTNPTEPFKKAGLFGRKLTPLFSENEVSKKEFKKYQIYQGLSHLNTGVAFFALGVSIQAVKQGNFERYDNALYTSIGTMVILFAVSSSMEKHLYRAIDSYNFGKSPLSPNSTSLIPHIQPSQYNIGIGLAWDLD